MLKEVQPNGQLALGEQFAGRRYDVQFRSDGGLELRPVPATCESDQWARQNAEAIEQYNVWAGERESYSVRVRRWRAAQSESSD